MKITQIPKPKSFFEHIKKKVYHKNIANHMHQLFFKKNIVL